MKFLMLLICFAPALSLSAADSGSALSEDRVGFPRGYTNFAVLRTTARDNGAKLVTVYGNGEAASVSNRTQLPYPNGAVLVMETAATKKGADGQPVKGTSGALQKGEVVGLHVMRRGKDFGQAYGGKRSGEWEFVEYRSDGSYLTPPQKSASCAECHIKAGPALDYVYKGRLAQ